MDPQLADLCDTCRPGCLLLQRKSDNMENGEKLYSANGDDLIKDLNLYYFKLGEGYYVRWNDID
ncbi:MAG: hypothetical protein IH946_06475 [Bacteroidetes bacterium]|nr:hypothetical protein [Bacteroidota bacterium]